MKLNKVDTYQFSRSYSIDEIIFLGLFSGGRNYEIISKINAKSNFTIRNELFNLGKKLFFLEDGEQRYIVNRKFLSFRIQSR